MVSWRSPEIWGTLPSPEIIQCRLFSRNNTSLWPGFLEKAKSLNLSSFGNEMLRWNSIFICWAKSVFSLALAGRIYLLVHLSSHCWPAIANLITAKVALGACAQVFCLILNLNKKHASRDQLITICDTNALKEKSHSFQPPLPPTPCYLVLQAVPLCKSAIIITPFIGNSVHSCQPSVLKWGFPSLSLLATKPQLICEALSQRDSFAYFLQLVFSVTPI